MHTELQGAHIFDLAPVPMWMEDYSGLGRLFDQWRLQGVEDVRAFLNEDVARIKQCSSAIRILGVNRKTLELYEANDQEHLVANLEAVFRDDMLATLAGELAELWDGKREFSSHAVNYTLTGKRLDIQLHARVLPGHEELMDRVLVTTEDVTEREQAQKQEQEHRRYAEGIFEHSPVSLWVEDFSGIKRLLEEVRDRGITDLRVFTDVHPEFVRQCMSEIRVIEVNQATLDLFKAPDRQTLLRQLPDIFRDDMEKHFREQLIELWNGNLFHQREVINYALDGSERYLLLQFSVFPGHEADWNLIQVALTDITARKKAEAYLEYLGKHDVLTRLHNRAFYTDELQRLERKSLRPVGAILIDVNGLKVANDQYGHQAGDSQLRRLGELLNRAVTAPNSASRIGGDEFVILMPGCGEESLSAMVGQLNRLLLVDNKFYASAPISVSMGWAVSEAGESISSMVRRADLAMYEQKRAHYAEKYKRRSGGTAAA